MHILMDEADPFISKNFGRGPGELRFPLTSMIHNYHCIGLGFRWTRFPSASAECRRGRSFVGIDHKVKLCAGVIMYYQCLPGFDIGIHLSNIYVAGRKSVVTIAVGLIARIKPLTLPVGARWQIYRFWIFQR